MSRRPGVVSNIIDAVGAGLLAWVRVFPVSG